jgi:tRNA (cmo5U34)-methyltransferase
VSAPASRAGWHDPGFAANFAHRRQAILPLIDVQEELIQQLLRRHDRAIERFLDLGAGAGAMTELVLALLPDATGVMVDFSELMLAHAREQLADLSARWQAVHGDLSEPAWSARLPAGRYDAVVSGLAIHHLSAERKRALFKELHALLEPGGILINMDYVTVAGPLRRMFDKRMRANALRAERASGGSCSEQAIDFDDGEDRPDTIEDQLRWLRDAGFVQVEVHFKWAEAAIFGGARLAAPGA